MCVLIRNCTWRGHLCTLTCSSMHEWNTPISVYICIINSRITIGMWRGLTSPGNVNTTNSTFVSIFCSILVDKNALYLATHYRGIDRCSVHNQARGSMCVKRFNWWWFCRLGVVAYSCNPVAWKPVLVDGLRSGVLPYGVLCRLGVRTKLGINMVTLGEPEVSRLSKEGRIGPGWKHSRQKSPCWAVVGSRLWIGIIE